MFRRILNFDQNAPNAMKLNAGETGCCGDTATVCQYTLLYAKAGAVTALTISENGANKVLPCVIAGGANPVIVRTAIEATLLAAGYEEDLVGDMFKGVVVVADATNNNLTFVGNAKIVSLTHAGGTATATERCTQRQGCDFVRLGYVGGAANSLAVETRINGIVGTLGAITPGTTTGAQLKTAVDSALAAAGVTSGTVVVVVNGSDGAQTYDITIPGVSVMTTIVLGGSLLTKQNCVVSFA